MKERKILQQQKRILKEHHVVDSWLIEKVTGNCTVSKPF